MQCPRCGSPSPDSKKFCADCGEVLDPNAVILDKLRISLKGDVENILKEKYGDQKTVELEIAEHVVEKVTGWGRTLLSLTGFALAALLAALSIVGISKLSDLSMLVEAAKKQAEQRMNREVNNAVASAQQKVKERVDASEAEAERSAKLALQTTVDQARQNLDKNLAALVTEATASLTSRIKTLEIKANRAIAGFDTSIYPGDSVMAVWKKASPYRFVAYYLRSPCHSNASWSGKRHALTDLGWLLVPVYVGRNTTGPCSSMAPTSELGASDATDAVQKATVEGLPSDSVLFLDVEAADTPTPGLLDYVAAWATVVKGGHFFPGVVCLRKNADALQAKVQNVWPAKQDLPVFWIMASGRLAIDSSLPADSGVAFAALWLGNFDQVRTFGGTKLMVDESVALVPSRVFPKVTAADSQ